VEALEIQLRDAQRLSRPNWDAKHAWGSAQRGRGHIPDEEIIAAYERIDLEHPLPSPDADELTDAMDSPMRRVMDLPADTPEGLAVKARLVQVGSDNLWREDPEALDWEERKLRSLVDAVLNFASRAKV
jgi:hypothetical protein